MNILRHALTTVVLLLALAAVLQAADIRSAGNATGTPVRGRWTNPIMWEGGVVPGAGDNVTISDRDTIYLDTTIAINDLTVGDGMSGVFIFDSVKAIKFTVNGNILVNTGGFFRCTGARNPLHNANNDTVYVHGDFINNGSVDFRTGSAPQLGIACIYFTGSGNSQFQSHGNYNTTTNEFNQITIDKSGTGRVFLGSTIYLAGGSSNADVASSQAYLHLKRGILETGNFCIISFSTAANEPPVIKGGSDSSYILGCFGRGMSSTSTATRTFPVGDQDGYRPIRVHNISYGGATGHYLAVRAMRGNPNPSGGALSGGIDKLSSFRYYELSYDTNVATAGVNPNGGMSFDRFIPSYTAEDGITAGNSDLRVAYTTDNLTNWKGMTQNHKDTTKLTTPPAYWTPDSLTTWMTLVVGGPKGYVTLARATGTTTNTLDFTTVGVNDNGRGLLPEVLALAQNYPNPFNPVTTIEYAVPAGGHVTLEVFNVLGQSVARLVDEFRPAGIHAAAFDASQLGSGVYLYRVTAGAASMTKAMLLVK